MFLCNEINFTLYARRVAEYKISYNFETAKKIVKKDDPEAKELA